jgi:cell division protein FtsL
MIKMINALLVVTVLGSGYTLYALEHSTRGLERQISKTDRKLDEARESIKLLNAEWSSLTRPERIQKLAEEHLALQATQAKQFVSVEDLLTKVPATVPVKLEEQGKDPIGDILKKMQ